MARFDRQTAGARRLGVVWDGREGEILDIFFVQFSQQRPKTLLSRSKSGKNARVAQQVVFLRPRKTQSNSS